MLKKLTVLSLFGLLATPVLSNTFAADEDVKKEETTTTTENKTVENVDTKATEDKAVETKSTANEELDNGELLDSDGGEDEVLKDALTVSSNSDDNGLVDEVENGEIPVDDSEIPEATSEAATTTVQEVASVKTGAESLLPLGMIAVAGFAVFLYRKYKVEA